MKKNIIKQISAAVAVLVLSTSSMSAFADFDTSLFDEYKDNYSSLSANTDGVDNIDIPNNNGQSSDMSLNESNPNNQNSVTQNNTSSTQDSSSPFGSMKEQINNEREKEDSQSANIDYNKFRLNMDSFLNSAGFDYSEFESMKFDLPDMTGVGTSADMKEEYADMLASFSEFNFGQRSTLPDNSGYSMNVIASFKDSFGQGLAKDLTEYKFTFDATDVFNQANDVRNSLFENVKNSSDYQIVSNNLNVTGLMNNINYNVAAHNLDPSQINTSMTGLGSLKSMISSAYNADNNSMLTKYNSSVSGTKQTFDDLSSNINEYKTKIDNDTKRWFVENPDKGPLRAVDQRTISLDEWIARTENGDQNNQSNNLTVKSPMQKIEDNLSKIKLPEELGFDPNADIMTNYQSKVNQLDEYNQELRENKYYTVTESIPKAIDNSGIAEPVLPSIGKEILETFIDLVPD